MKKMLILGSSNGSIEIINYAKSQGIYTIVTDYFPKERSRAKRIADETWDISTADVDALEMKCREKGVNAVICGVSEFNQSKAIELCERLNLPCYCDKKSWGYASNKAEFKALCRKIGAPIPKDYYLTDALTEEELASVEFPVVVKPVDQSSNKGLSFCYNKEELIEAYRYARSVSNDSRIVVERLLHGEEFDVYYSLADGESSLIAMVGSYMQPDQPGYCYILNSTLVRHTKQYREEMDEYAKKLIQEMGCREGMCWFEMIWDETDERFYFIEMGYRLTGEMTFLPMKEAFGVDYIRWMVSYACNGYNDPKDLPQTGVGFIERNANSYVLWTDRKGVITEINGIEEVEKIPGVSVQVMRGVGDAVDIYRPIAIALFAADNCDEMCGIVEKINRLVTIKNEKGENMIIYFSDFDTVKQRSALAVKEQKY